MLQSQSKLLGRFCVFSSLHCWCTWFANWIAISNIGREKGSTGKEKKAFVLTVPTIFVWDCSYILPKWQAVKLTFFAPYYVACQNFTLMKCCSAHNGHWGFPSLSENYGSKKKEKTLRAFHSTKLSKIMETVANGKDISRKSFQKSQKLLNLRNMNH